MSNVRSLAVLRDDTGSVLFSLGVHCDGVPCRAVTVVDPDTEAEAVRFVAKGPGRLTYSLRNQQVGPGAFFSLKRAKLPPHRRWADGAGRTVNEFNIAMLHRECELRRDNSTGCAMRLEVLRNRRGAPLRDEDAEVHGVARTKFRLQIAPALHKHWDSSLSLAGCTWSLHDVEHDDLTVSVETAEDTLLVVTKPRHTVRQLKERALRQMRSQAAPDSFRLIFNGEVLDDDEVLLETDVGDFSTVHLLSSGYFFIRTLAGKKFMVQSEMGITVEEVKQMVTMAAGVPVPRQQLVYDSMVMEDTLTLADYDVDTGAVLALVMRLRGSGGEGDSTTATTERREPLPLPEQQKAGEAEAEDLSKVSKVAAAAVGDDDLPDPADLVVGKVVPGELLPPTKTMTANLRVMRRRASPPLQFEVYLDPQALPEGDPSDTDSDSDSAMEESNDSESDSEDDYDEDSEEIEEESDSDMDSSSCESDDSEMDCEEE